MNVPLLADLPLFEVRFASLFKPGSGYAFPCDREGRVNLDKLSERSRMNYLFARAMVGREIAFPRIFVLSAASAADAEVAAHH